MLTIKKIDEVYMKVICDDVGVLEEISEYFTFMVDGYKFMPSYRNKVWDGKIRLFSKWNKRLYIGLLASLQYMCKERGYEVFVDEALYPDDFSVKEAQDFIKEVGLPFDPREYQMEAFIHAVRQRRSILVSPTGSGKSLIIYLLARYFGVKTLIIVNSIGLLHQMAQDFKEYGYDKEMHKISAGVEKFTNHDITISTQQSIHNIENQDWFDQFDVVIGDEVHLFKAKTFVASMEKFVSTPYRFGLTGSLDDSLTNKLVLQGLFGSIYQVATTKKLIDEDHLSAFQIKCILLKHNDEDSKSMRKKTYQEEMEYLIAHEKRNRFIKKLALSLSGNTLLLFQYVEKHGKVLHDMIKDNGIETFYIHGGVDGEERNDIRGLVEKLDRSVIIASYGTFSTGVNIKNLHNIIFASPSKSKIRNLQSIGRGLRKNDGKEMATLFDIADDLRYMSAKGNVSKSNTTLDHFVVRCSLYDSESFDYKIYNVRLT